MQDSDQFFTGHSTWNRIKVLWFQVCFFVVQWSLSLTTGITVLLRKGSFLLVFVLLVFCFAVVVFGRDRCSINIVFVPINKTFG